MKKILFCIITSLLITTSSYAAEYLYSVGLKGGVSSLSGSSTDSVTFPFQSFIGGTFGYRFHRNWVLEFSYSKHTLYDDTTKSSSLTIGADKANAYMKWKADRFNVLFRKALTYPDAKINLESGLGAGLMNWSILDPETDSLFNVTGLHNEMVDYKASELFFTAMLGLNFNLSSRWMLTTDIQADYMTGAGQEFESSVKSARNKWHFTTGISLKVLFGGFKATDWTSEKNWEQPQPIVIRKNNNQIDSDADGVPDNDDDCPETKFGAIVNRSGCPIDSDADGVPDGLDHCPSTDRKAIGSVDIYGCAVDSDFDGIADFEDACPNNQVGAMIDEFGCPVDSDADGVPDGLDDCPYTLYGVSVDKHGCIDLSILSQPLVLNIDYPSGSFEVDPRNRERLKDLSRILNFVEDVKIEINGYTDNIGTTVANKKLSEKRANRVRDYLVSLKVSTNRIKVFGKGETNFIASNDTSAGRAKNRRIEIIFYK